MGFVARNKQLLLDATERLNAGDLDGYRAAYAADAVVHGLPLDSGERPEDHVAYLHSLRAAFPDLVLRVDELIGEGQSVVARLRCTGTHEGAFGDLAPTGRACEWRVIAIRRFDDDGATVEHFIANDRDGLERQLRGE